MSHPAIEPERGREAPARLARSAFLLVERYAEEHGQPATLRRPPAGVPPAARTSGSEFLRAPPMTGRIYVDHASTTPVAQQALEAMLPYLGARFGNPSSLHSGGLGAREAVEAARGSVAALLDVPAGDLLFTSSA